MKKKLLFFCLFMIISLFYVTDTYAYDQSNYASRALCGNFEVALFKADGTIETKTCHSNYDEAYLAMVQDGNPDLAVLGKWDGVTKIYNANAALIDLTGPTGTFNIYPTSEIQEKTEHTYMTGASGYGGVDAPLIAVGYSSSAKTFTAQMKISGYTGWIRLGIVEIVPLVWVKSSNSYTITSETIRHNYVTKIQNTYSGSSGCTIGPKPTMLEPGTYYSYDGHYFYTDRYKMIEDYKAGNYNNSVNKDTPYYNYYQFLPQHTRTTYSSINIDEYVRNVMGLQQDVYGSKAVNHAGYQTSRLYGKGAFFYNAQELYGANALLAFGVSRNESGNGTSNLSINKNNGFGLNAVDSNPTEASDWFPTFAQSIYDYNNIWVTYGYSNPTVWKYFGAQNGNKFVGMNVKYASDVNWGEKMASNYYFLDKAYGLQDYNYYQTAVTTKLTAAYTSPSTTERTPIYYYKSADIALVLLEEVEGTEVEGNTTWYKVVSDMNLDSNFNPRTSGYYNWDSYVYVPAAHVYKINEGKNGYISPNDVPKHKDSDYTYDLHTENAVLKPKVAVSVKDTSYYFDPSLISKTGQTLLNNRYVMVYTTAYDENKNVIAYLITSDYKYEQKHWVSADSIKFVTSAYGQASVTVPGQNLYTTVNPTTVDELSTHISGLYHYGYTPILEEKIVDGQLWYKVPVSLSTSSNIFGWTLASAENVLITKYQYTATNQAPVINASNKTLMQGQAFDEKEGVSATDAEDGDLTESIIVTSNNVNKDVPGTYQVTYQVTDKGNASTFKTITVTVIKDEEPTINATNKTIKVGDTFNPKEGVTATDKEDGPITDIIVDDSKVNYNQPGTYEITYTVKDSFGHTVTKTIQLTIESNQVDEPEDDEEDDEEAEEREGTFYFDYLDNKDNKLMLRGYLTINGMNNTLNEDITYYIGFINTTNLEDTYIQEATRITNLTGINRPIYSADGYTYTHSWFEAELDIENLPVGNYIMAVVANYENLITSELVTNKLYKTEITGFQSENKSVNIKNNYGDRTSAVTLYVREKETPIKTVGSYYNQYDVWRIFEFTDNKLHLKGASYSYGMNLAKDQSVSRTLIFENKDTYETYTYDIGSITNGLYTVALPESDNLDKTRAWYDVTLDITNLPKGKYKLYMTTSSNVTDYSEFTDNLGRDLSQKKITIGDKNYQFSLNQEEGNSIELEVS